MELKEVFEQARGDRDIKDLIELDLEKAKCATLDGLPDELAELTIFNASNLGLENLNGLPLMPKLHTLDLSENKLKGESLKVLIEKTPALEQLNLCGNLIEVCFLMILYFKFILSIFRQLMTSKFLLVLSLC
jgi:Leucine-rich repeat (LRR) protein